MFYYYYYYYYYYIQVSRTPESPTNFLLYHFLSRCVQRQTSVMTSFRSDRRILTVPHGPDTTDSRLHNRKEDSRHQPRSMAWLVGTSTANRRANIVCRQWWTSRSQQWKRVLTCQNQWRRHLAAVSTHTHTRSHRTVVMSASNYLLMILMLLDRRIHSQEA